MNDEQKAMTMYKMGFGDFNEKAGLKEPVHEKPRRRAIWSDWKLERMPYKCAHIKLDLPITDEEFEELVWGHIPHAMEDHWFMYFDGKCFDFHRSWTGFCIYRVHVERNKETGQGYLLTSVTANRKPEQYSETSDARDLVMAHILLGEALGYNMGELWDKWFELGEPQERELSEA